MRVRRQMIKIDEEKCTGCGLCIPNCPEGALQVIDGKARLISDLFCDGLGACLGHCPDGAIAVEEREAEPYDERQVMENIARQGPNVIAAHLEHLRSHGATEHAQTALAFLRERGIPVPQPAEAEHAHSGCPGARMMELEAQETPSPARRGRVPSRLRNWPIQIALVSPQAPYFQGADLLIAADCTGFASPELHEALLEGKVLLVGCPKLDDVDACRQKLAQILAQNDIHSVRVLFMEVPCCYGMVRAVQQALADAKKSIPLVLTQIGIRGAIEDQTE